MLFITGAPRSGTSLLTKVIDAHPDISLFMENIFENRRRHWKKADYWHSPEKFRTIVTKEFKKLDTSIVGNKVCTPDVWSPDDILQFCQLFSDYMILFIVRGPAQVMLSRFKREEFSNEFNQAAKRNILLDFRTQFLTYASSWRQSIEGYWRLRDGIKNKICLIYYENLCTSFEGQVKAICRKINVPFNHRMLTWHKIPHTDSSGNLRKNLKYIDEKVELKTNNIDDIPENKKKEMSDALDYISFHLNLWEQKKI